MMFEIDGIFFTTHKYCTFRKEIIDEFILLQISSTICTKQIPEYVKNEIKEQC